MRTLYVRHIWQAIFDSVMKGVEQDDMRGDEQKMDFANQT